MHRGVLRRPLLYLSLYLKENRTEYYDRLTAIRRRGDWEGWLAFFLRGVAQTAAQATETAERIFELREEHRARVIDEGLGANGLKLLSLLFQSPIVNVRLVERRLGVVFATASKLVSRFEALGLVHEMTGRQRSRRFSYDPYLALFQPARTDPATAGPAEITSGQ
jgi:Fic family protein